METLISWWIRSNSLLRLLDMLRECWEWTHKRMRLMTTKIHIKGIILLKLVFHWRDSKICLKFLSLLKKTWLQIKCHEMRMFPTSETSTTTLVLKMMPCKLSDLSPSSILLISTKDNSLKLWRKKDQKLRLTNSIMVSHLLPINPPPDKCLKSNLLQMRLLLKNRKSQEICW
jgi:hypothetical protein